LLNPHYSWAQQLGNIITKWRAQSQLRLFFPSYIHFLLLPFGMLSRAFLNPQLSIKEAYLLPSSSLWYLGMFVYKIFTQAHKKRIVQSGSFRIENLKLPNSPYSLFSD